MPEVRQIIAEIPRRQCEMLAHYLHRHVEHESLRNLDPTMMAQAFLGMIFAYAIYHSLFEIELPDESEISAVVDLFVDIYIKGVTKVK